jgi:hypothetical protein
VSYAGSRVMRVPSYDGRPVVRYDERTPPDLALALGGSGCTVYVRSSLCGSPEGRPRCRVVERKLAMSARASTELPAVPSVVAAPYSGDRVTVGLYDVEGLVGTTETGAAATTGAAVAPAP